MTMLAEPAASTTDDVVRESGERARRPILVWTAAVGLFVFFLLSAAWQHPAASDSYFDLYSGRYIATHGLPHVEALTAAAHGRPWIAQQWLAQWTYYSLWRLGGYSAFVLASATLVATAFALLMRALLRAAVAAPRALIWTLLAVIACTNNTVPRSQSFAYPLFVTVLSLVLLDAHEPRWRRRLLLVVPALVLWANLHGSVLLGAGIVTAYAGWRVLVGWRQHDLASARGYGLLVGLAALSPLATPYGWSIVGYYRSVLGNSTLTHQVVEWHRPALSDHLSYGYFFVLVVASATIFIRCLRRRGWPPLPLLAVTIGLLALSTQAMRNEIWFVLAAVMLAAVAGAGAARRSSDRLMVLFATVSALLAVLGLGVSLVRPVQFNHDVSVRVLTAADSAAQSRPGAAVLADEVPSAALLWLRPDSAGLVAFDIRFEQYPSALLARYTSFLRGDPGALSFASRYGVVVLPTHGRDTALRLFRQSRQWRVLAEDSRDVAFVMRPGP